ncbi:MAG TPA: glycosyltransferase family 4 protein [Rudaea sp.]
MNGRRYRQVFVIGAYVPNGGTRMAYHIARILDRDFGIPAIAVRVGDETPQCDEWAYDLQMPCVSIPEMERRIGPDDILIVNPSFSDFQFGMRLPGFKLCYVQGFNTFGMLDLRFDHYVAISGFVAGFLRNVFAIEANVIPGFIDVEDSAPPPWSERTTTVLPYRKGMTGIWNASFDNLKARLAREAPRIAFSEPLASIGVPHRQLLEQLGRAQCVLFLSAGEGFGLVPLEAMSMGSLVVGYDGFGGREYMRSGENCLVAPYPQVERIAEFLIDVARDPHRAQAIAQRGRQTATAYSYAAFRERWMEELARALGVAPAASR